MYDDVPLIVDNALLRDGGGLRTLLLHARMTSAPIWPGHYRPLLMLTYWLEYQYIGTAPWSYRLLDLAIHLANGFLIFVLVQHLWRRRDEARASLVAALAASLWLVHPIHAIAIALVLKRNTSLCVLLMLLAMLAWLGRRDRVALVLGVAALLVKEDALVLPALLALVAALDEGRVPWRRLLPFFVFPLGMAIWALLRHHPGGAALAYLSAQPIALVRYLGMLIDPRAIAAAYDLEPGVTAARLAGVALLGATLGLAWLWRRRFPWLAAAIAWTALALAPSSSLIAIAPAMDEIRVYLAFVPLFVLVAALLVRARLGVALAVALVLASAALSLERAQLWRDPPSLWAAAVARYPDSKIGNRALCEARPATGQCRRAVALWPDDPYARYDLVAALVGAGDLAAARAEAERSVADFPRAPMAWLALGHFAWVTDDNATAARAYRRVLALDPDNESARSHLADVLKHTR